VRERLARRTVEAVIPEGWVVDGTGFPKDGLSSPGVARQYCGSLGKVGNCQVGVSIDGHRRRLLPLSGRLFVPERWDDSCAASPEAAAACAERRRLAGIPAEVRHREKWRLALDMVDGLAGWGLAPPVVADAGYGDIAQIRDGLSARGRVWVLKVQGVLSAHAEAAVPALVPASGRGRPAPPRYGTPPVALREHVLAAVVPGTLWDGSRGPLTS
jgi:SRSO17 transposase